MRRIEGIQIKSARIEGTQIESTPLEGMQIKSAWIESVWIESAPIKGTEIESAPIKSARNKKRSGRGGGRRAAALWLALCLCFCLSAQTPALAAKGPLISGAEENGPAEGPALESYESGGEQSGTLASQSGEMGDPSGTSTGQSGEMGDPSGSTSGQPGQQETAYSEEQLNDNLIEYGELRALLLSGTGTVKSAVSDYESSLANYQAAYDVLVSARRDMINEADELEDQDGDPTLIARYDANAETLSLSAKQMKKRINSLSSATSQGSLDRSIDAVVKTAQTLMSSCKELEYQAVAAAKRAEAAAASYERLEKERAAGLCTAEELQSGQKELLAAQISAQSASDSADSRKRQLAVLLGRDADRLVIGEIPHADAQEIAALNLEEDKEKAVIADPSVKSIRRTSATGDTQRALRRQQLSEAEAEETVTMDRLYQDLVVKSIQNDAAEVAFAAAEQDYGALQKKYAAGLINRIEYLSGEADYLERKADRKSASIGLSQALTAYRWEVKGVG